MYCSSCDFLTRFVAEIFALMPRIQTYDGDYTAALTPRLEGSALLTVICNQETPTDLTAPTAAWVSPFWRGEGLQNFSVYHCLAMCWWKNAAAQYVAQMAVTLCHQFREVSTKTGLGAVFSFVLRCLSIECPEKNSFRSSSVQLCVCVCETEFAEMFCEVCRDAVERVNAINLAHTSVARSPPSQIMRSFIHSVADRRRLRRWRWSCMVGGRPLERSASVRWSMPVHIAIDERITQRLTNYLSLSERASHRPRCHSPSVRPCEVRPYGHSATDQLRPFIIGSSNIPACARNQLRSPDFMTNVTVALSQPAKYRHSAVICNLRPVIIIII